MLNSAMRVLMQLGMTVLDKLILCKSNQNVTILVAIKKVLPLF